MKKAGIFTAVTVMLILVSAFCITGTVMSHNNKDLEIQEKYYSLAEQQYVDAVRQYMAAQGFRNSGVMLTRVVDTDGTRTYTLTVCHKRLAGLTEVQKENIEEALTKMEFDIPGCRFERRLQAS